MSDWIHIGHFVATLYAVGVMTHFVRKLRHTERLFKMLRCLLDEQGNQHERLKGWTTGHAEATRDRLDRLEKAVDALNAMRGGPYR